MSLIPGYPDGSDITFLNSYYCYPEKIDDRVWTKDSITIIYKDNKTGEKKHCTIEEPDYEYYKVKDEYVKDYSQLFIDKKCCDKIVVPYRDLEKSIAEQTNNLEFYNNNIRNRARSENRKLHADPSIMFSDTNIEDHYRYRFGKLYTNNIPKLNKGYFDIEVDGKYQMGDFPELGEVPINCCSYFDESTDCIYTFILRNPENPLIEEFEKSINEDLFAELHDFIIEKVGGWKQATRFGIMNTKNKFYFYDDEMEMIYEMFKLFHHINPDFILAWNMAFDIPYVIERCYNLGYDPASVMTNPDHKVKKAKYYVDERNKNDLAERGDFATISGDIVFIDQMIQFASRRKNKIGSFNNFKLDYIGELVAKVKKLDYSHITNSVIELPYLDFKTFVFYNIMDVVNQRCIEKKNQDIEYIFTKCLVNNTSYRKGHRQSVYLANRFAKDFYEDGYIIGNNVNRWNEKPEKYAGALVGRPENTNNYSKIFINGRPTMVANNMIDEDFKALYPNITLENNIAPNTLLAAIKIPEKVYDRENFYNNEKYNRAGEYIENLVTDNVIEFSHRYLKLAGFKEFVHGDMLEYYEKYLTTNQLTMRYNYGIYITDQTQFNAIKFYNSNRNAIKFYPDSLDYTPYIDKIRKEVG